MSKNHTLIELLGASKIFSYEIEPKTVTGVCSVVYLQWLKYIAKQCGIISLKLFHLAINNSTTFN